MGYGFGVGGRAAGRVVGEFIVLPKCEVRRDKCVEGCCGYEVGFFWGVGR